jgi:hypothetical protein
LVGPQRPTLRACHALRDLIQGRFTHPDERRIVGSAKDLTVKSALEIDASGWQAGGLARGRSECAVTQISPRRGLKVALTRSLEA